MSVQFIEQNGVRQYAVIPVEAYDRLLEKAELLNVAKRAVDIAIETDEKTAVAYINEQTGEKS